MRSHPTPLLTPFLLGLISVGFLVGGCASPRRVAFPTEQHAQIGSGAAVAGFSKPEIGTEIVRSNTSAGMGAAGGAIGSLIGSVIDASVNTSRAKEAEQAAATVRDALLTYDTPATLSQALRGELSKVEWLKTQSVEIRDMTDPAKLPDLVKGAATDAILLVETRYSLTPFFDGVIVTARVSLHPRQGSLLSTASEKEKLPKLVYLNRVSTTWTCEGLSGTKDGLVQNAAMLSADGGKRVRECLTSALAELGRMIAYDLEQPARPENRMYNAAKDQKRRTVTIVPDLPMVQGMQGYVERVETNREWVRLPAGELCALPCSA